MRTFQRAFISILAAAAVLPAAAAAQTAIAPPGGDNYLQPLFLNDTAHPFPPPCGHGRTTNCGPVGFTADTTNYTTQPDLFNPPGSGGPAEPVNCGGSTYGNTIWAVFFANRFGVMDIATSNPSFDSVIGVVPFQDPNTNPRPDLAHGVCSDSLRGFTEDLHGIVVPRQWYAVQVGGTGMPMGGQLGVKFAYNPPPTVKGDAVLTWNTGSGGAIIKSLVVSKIAKGETVEVTCSHRGCGKNPPHRNGKVSGAAFKPLVHAAAKTFKFLGGRKAKSGTTIEVKVLDFGFIGADFTWKVKGNGVGPKLVRCINAGSKKPRKGSCH